MLNPNESRTGPSAAAAIADLEKRMEEFYSGQQSEVEQGLLEKITREKEEAQRKIDAVRQEFEKLRGVLEEHRTVITELELARESLRTRIQEHFGHVVDHQKLIEKAATLSIDELQRIDELNRELADICRRATAETAALRDLLKGHAEIAPELPAFPETPETSVDWSKELLKMKKVQALLTSSNGSEPHSEEPAEDVEGAARELAPAAETASPEPEPEAAPQSAPEAAAGDEPDPELAAASEPTAEPSPEPAQSAASVSGSADDTGEFSETDPGWDAIPDAGAAAAAAPSPASESEPRGQWLDDEATRAAKETIEDVVPEQARHSESLSRVLADYRKSEPINNGIELGFFEVGTTAMLDGESFVSAIDGICAAARDLHGQLTRTESVKDLFLLKQEILNQQEILRKVYFRVVRFCDKESGVLPTFLEDIVNVPAMKDSLERLTMANWSDPSDFAPFVREIEALKSAFEAKTDPPGDYIQSVLEQIGLN